MVETRISRNLNSYLESSSCLQMQTDPILSEQTNVAIFSSQGFLPIRTERDG